MSTFKNVGDLERHLATRSYVKGFSLSDADKAALSALSGIPDKASFPNAYRWAIHVIALVGLNNITFSGSCSGASAAPKKVNDDFDDMFGDEEEKKPAPKAAEADFDDMFGDDDETEEERAANKARQERMALAKRLKEEKDAREGKVKKDKPKPVEKSLIVLDVKPWEADCDLEAVWKEIIKYEQEGLQWGATYKLEPVAFGIKKLVMTCTIVDSLVLLDDVTDNIEAMEDYVQSVTVASMNKI
mmetsp:Transcript_23072/g.33787  ORF Transcript_23072/g.33787 Transcript_23072/m.33787 type:complete len:244 (+) Transcript_23072:54-785(+)|eukprot:CAMPEP_0185025430 /NCGR_PEP_ID=MMETSP1103-20130426/8391_1 /TAXON_ID=36769 /ORGANISM="Paraphysomonas bandaiensis, Strain Caron Lab Isolate" /LENGTH=243 /DNA_ID=CAMNT_0027558629 /DNA_START=52 /DNA_END=783 /DNA_ORIENTATION=+